MKSASWKNWIVLQPERVLLRKHISMMLPKEINSVLDVGGGSGERYRNLINSKVYVCLDNDPNLHPDVLASADDIPFPNESFDFILSSQMLEHVEDPKKCIEEMFRVCSKGGHLLITVPQTNELHSEPHDYWRFTSFGVEHLLNQAGFKIKKLSQRGNYPVVIAQMRIRRLIDMTDVYNNKKWLLILFPLSVIYVKTALFLDKVYSGVASRKHTLGWTYLAEKI